ncbi:MAG: hypothetical protein U0N38_00105 [Acutalibacteraceae bacterium]|jgi:chromate transport protein ChrA
MDLVIGIILDVIATAALVYLFIFGYNSEYEAAGTIIAPVLIYIIWSRRVQMIKTRKWREKIEKQTESKEEKAS